MKKLITVILALAMVLGVFTSCGTKDKSKQAPANTTAENTAAENTTTENTVQTENNDTDNTVIDGAELSTFMGNYMDTKGKVWDAMSKELEKDPNNPFAMASLGFAFADLAVVEVGLFDTLTVKVGDTYKGALMLSGIEAFKKVKGDIIEFGYDFTYNEDKNQSKKGDREVASGKFDKKDGSLYYERYTERDSKKIQKTVIEITRNSDSSYSSQLYFIGSNGSDSSAKNDLSGYFTWFDGQNLISYMGEKADQSFDFTFSSIYGKKNVKPDEMASGMKITAKSSFIDGKASFEATNE